MLAEAGEVRILRMDIKVLCAQRVSMQAMRHVDVGRWVVFSWRQWCVT